VHFDVGVLYIRNVRNLGPGGLKVSVGNVLLEGLYRLNGRLRPRGLSSVYSSIKGLVRAGHALLRSGTSDGALLHPRWSREHNGGGSGGRHRGDVCDVGVLVGLVALLGLAFASVFTTLVLGLCYRLDKRINCLTVGATSPGSAVRMTRVSYTSHASVRGLASGHQSNRSVLAGYLSLVSG
jgi:hypothetical protein